MDDMCGPHMFQIIKPIFTYVDQLQTENNKWEIKQEEVNKMREQIQQLHLQIAEGKYKDVLIVTQQDHIKDLQDTLRRELTKTDVHISKLQLYEDQLKNNNKTLAAYAAQIKNKDDTLKNLQNEVQGYKDQLETTKKTIAENTAQISLLTAEIKLKSESLKESQIKLNEYRNTIIKQNETIQVQVKNEVIPNSCISFGDSNSVHNIQIPNFESFSVLCNSKIAGPGWTVIQQRIHGKEDFYRDWESYKSGFGSLSGDFFLGLEKIYRLTHDQPHELYMHMERFNGESIFARYNHFAIAGEENKYNLTSLGSYSGNANNDQMRYHEGNAFSTFDSDNDKWKNGNCAKGNHGGWWYNECCYV